MKRRTLSVHTSYQFGFAVLIITALASQFIYGGIAAGGFTLGYIALFFSYFTILSNIFVAIVLYKGAQAGLKKKKLPSRIEWLRGFAVFCIATTGIIYTFFLRGPAGFTHVENVLPWTNLVFHSIMPVVMALDWVFFPPKHVVRWTAIIYWIMLAAVYALYAEALGRVSDIYPYFFLDPTKLNGYAGVARACVSFIPFLLVIGGIIVLANKIRTRKRAAP